MVSPKVTGPLEQLRFAQDSQSVRCAKSGSKVMGLSPPLFLGLSTCWLMTESSPRDLVLAFRK